MAVTFIKRIHATIDQSIDYIRRDKVVYRGEEAQELLRKEALEFAEDYISSAVDYIERHKEVLEDGGKVEIKKTLTSTLNCTYDGATNEFRIVRDMYEDISSGVGGNKEVSSLLGYHVWQSFDEKISAELANEIGVKLADEMYGEHQCVISTHTNTEHTHNHIVFNAYKLDGTGKYRLTTAETRRLREVSDRLCEEYGLHVLEKTRDMRLCYYKDADGNKRWFEPTERKSQIEKGEYSNKTDYRNYEAYERTKDFEESHRKIVRRDIDRFIPLSRNLNHLMEHLRGIGYQVRNKDVKGKDLTYIKFKAPNFVNFVRGKADTLGEDYTREGIVRRIEEAISQGMGGKSDNPNVKLPVYDFSEETENENDIGKVVYNFESTDIGSLNEEVRLRYNAKVKKWIEYPRYEVEQFIVTDTKLLKKSLDDMYAEALGYNKPKINYKGREGRINYLEKCIRENLESLAFVENKNLESFEEINENARALQDIKIDIQNNVMLIKSSLTKMHELLQIVKRYNNLKQTIEQNEAKADYVVFEKQGDMALLSQYETVLKASKLTSVREQIAFSKDYDNAKAELESLLESLKEIKGKIDEYDKTVRVIDRIDRDSDRRYRSAIKEYYNIKKHKEHHQSHPRKDDGR